MTMTIAVATKASASKLMTHRGTGPQSVNVDVKTTGVGVLFSMEKMRLNSSRVAALKGDTDYRHIQTGYTRTGSATSFSSQSLHAPVAPGSLVVDETAASPAVKDFNKDGLLYLDGHARKRASGGTFAAMAAESLVVKIDGSIRSEITFATEASIAAAVAAINLQLKGGYAVAQGAQDVDLYSDTTGPDSSVEVISCTAAVTTKLGIAVGTATSYVGVLNYFTGALTMAYPGSYAPSAGGAYVETSVDAPFDLEPAMTLSFKIDGAGSDVATFDAAKAKLTGAAGTFAAMAAETMVVRFETGELQTITFGTEATIALAVATINAQLKGGYAVAQGAQNVDIYSDLAGTSSRVRTSSVAANITTKLGIANNGDATGTGDVANINAVTAAEVETVVEADVTGVSVLVQSDGSVRFSSVAGVSVQVEAASTADTAMGLDNIAHTATAGNGPLMASYVKTTRFLNKDVDLLPNLSSDEELSVYAIGDANSQVQVDVSPLK